LLLTDFNWIEWKEYKLKEVEERKNHLPKQIVNTIKKKEKKKRENKNLINY